MTFNDGRWNIFPSYHIIGDFQTFTQTCHAIYLHHANGSHYDVVTCVKGRDDVMHCATLCQITEEQSSPMQLRKRFASPKISKTEREKDEYQTNNMFRLRKKRNAKLSYNYANYRQSVCESRKVKYATNPQFQADVRESSKVKYATNTQFQADVREYSKVKYATNTEFKAKVQMRRQKTYCQYKSKTRHLLCHQMFSKTNFNGSRFCLLCLPSAAFQKAGHGVQKVFVCKQR